MAQDARDGEVVYVIRADDSLVDGDLDAAERKVKKSAEDTSEKVKKAEKETGRTIKQEKDQVVDYHKEKNDEIVKDEKQSGEERTKSEAGVTEKIKGYINEAADQSPILSSVKDVTGGLTGASAAWVGIGAAAVTVGGMAVSSATDMQQAMNDYLASTGKGKEETERYQQILEDIYANNYGESFGDIAEAMAGVNKQLGELDDESLQSITESAFALRDTFDYDVSESTRAAKALIDNFGISGEDAMGLIAAGAQDGLDFSGELLDSISEYSTQFAKVGLDADDMFKIFATGTETGAWNLDKIGDAVKELGIRVIDGSDSTKEGFELIGLNADEMAGKFAAGGETAKEAFEQTIDALAGLEDPLAQNQAGVDLFGTMWEDLGPEVVTQLANIGDEAYATAEDMETLKDVKYDDFGATMEGLKRNLELLLVPLGEALIPFLSMLAETLLPLITEVLTPILELIIEILKPILELISTALQPLIEVIGELIREAMEPLQVILDVLLSAFQEVMNGISESVKSQIESVTTIFQNLIDFIKNVFTGDWEGAWKNIKTIFKNIADSLGSVFKAPINAIIDLINGFLGGLNKIQIPDWVPKAMGGGKGFNIPKISRLKSGIDFVPSDYYPAFLDYGERVLTREENQALSRFGGAHDMEVGLGAGGENDLTKAVREMTDAVRSKKFTIEKGAIQMTQELDGKVAGKVLAPYIDTEFGEDGDANDRA